MAARHATVLTHLNLARGYRGGERQTELLIRGLASLGWPQCLVTRRGQPLARRLGQGSRAGLQEVPGLVIRETGLGVPGAALALRDATLVHCHEGRGVQAGWIAHVLRGTPYLVTRRVQKGPGPTAFNRRMYRRAAAVVALSEAIRTALARLDPSLPVTIIPSASAGLVAKPGNVERLRGMFGGDFVVGHVGALDDSHKGQSQIIGLARRLRTAAPGMRFVMVGSGIDETRLREAAAGLDNVIFAGQVENVGDYLAAFDLFLYPSRHEGLGSILLDALEFGLPVVATAVGGIVEIITSGEHGLLVPLDDPDKLEAAVMQLYRDTEFRARVQAANRHRARDFSATVMTGRYAALYRDLAARLCLDLGVR
jgi:glycosyltransferase involved in cell wall biosynthesis